uniref:Claudin n=2 Tax=Electrophorus electricus TaxID=8005 RepID=A0A4W4FD92_ELEEL
MSVRQIAALLAGLVGLGATFGATVSNEWKNTSRASSVITATWIFQGLWMNCAGNALGAVHCRQHHTIFKLEGYVQAVRGLLLFGMATGFFAAILCFIGMDCTNIGGNERTNDKILLTGAVFHFLGGMADAAGYCLFTARLGKATFARLAGRGVVRYEIGSPIYLGLVGSFCIIMGSIFYAVSVYRFFLPNRELDVPGPRKDMAPQIYVPLTKNETLFKGENNAATQSRPSSLSSIQASGTSRSTETSDRDAFV